MSVYYTIMEKLKVKGIGQDRCFDVAGDDEGVTLTELVGMMQSQLCNISSAMMMDCGKIREMVLTVDGKTTTFSGDILNEETDRAIKSMAGANEVDVFVHYDYSWYPGGNAGPFRMMDILDQVEESIFDWISYTAFNMADCADVPGGNLCSYYKRDGIVHRGETSFVEGAIPSECTWYSPDTMMYTEGIYCSEEEYKQLEEMVQKVHKYTSDTPDLEYDEGYPVYFMNNIELHGSEQLREFADFMFGFQKWMDAVAARTGQEKNGYGGIICEDLICSDAWNPHKLKIDVDGDAPLILIAQGN